MPRVAEFAEPLGILVNNAGAIPAEICSRTAPVAVRLGPECARLYRLNRDHRPSDPGFGVAPQLGTKLWTSEPDTSRQPSTSTKKISLSGSEIDAGGSIIMPRLISTLATTRSITRNGR